MFALVDCNNFYASCERVFQPRLEKCPVVVLSNNDGCIIARSNEAKKLGTGMGEPFFEVRPLIERHGLAVRSSNYELYGDMSQRVMQTLLRLTSDVEIYSIDEAFCDLTGFLHLDLEAYGWEIKDTVKRWTGLPVGIGIGKTKTLAKLANNAAKKSDGVTVLQSEAMTKAILAMTPVRDVWGIGRQYDKFLEKDEAADEERSTGEDKPSGERNAGKFWHSDGAMKSFWHSFGTVEGEISLWGNIPAVKSRIINTHKQSGRSAAW
jgi:DNA polymerase V